MSPPPDGDFAAPSLSRVVLADCRLGDRRLRIRPYMTPFDGIPSFEARALAAIERELVFASKAERSQADVAEHLGISQQRVSQYEKSALKKMRKGASEVWAEDTGPTLHRSLGSIFATNGQKDTGLR